jgi:hypothetical protein
VRSCRIKESRLLVLARTFFYTDKEANKSSSTVNPHLARVVSFHAVIAGIWCPLSACRFAAAVCYADTALRITSGKFCNLNVKMLLQCHYPPYLAQFGRATTEAASTHSGKEGRGTAAKWPPPIWVISDLNLS